MPFCYWLSLLAVLQPTSQLVLILCYPPPPPPLSIDTTDLQPYSDIANVEVSKEKDFIWYGHTPVALYDGRNGFLVLHFEDLGTASLWIANVTCNAKIRGSNLVSVSVVVGGHQAIITDAPCVRVARCRVLLIDAWNTGSRPTSQSSPSVVLSCCEEGPGNFSISTCPWCPKLKVQLLGRRHQK